MWVGCECVGDGLEGVKRRRMDVRFVAGVYGLERLTEIVKQSRLIVFVEQNLCFQSEISQLRVGYVTLFNFHQIQTFGSFIINIYTTI